jgi:prepilin-type N-terminal cleavage/methylation domain-containing protein
MNKLNTNKKGFTIIEVVLVLAIAGLIFMMVFLAYPALRRSQRDTQRQNDVSRLMTAIQNYQTNNRGKVPDDDSKWNSFKNDYLLVNTNGAADTFEDPDGSPYDLEVVTCEQKDATGECKAEQQRYLAATTFKSQAHKILVVKKAVCDGEITRLSNGERNIAVAYKKEGGGVICQSL